MNTLVIVLIAVVCLVAAYTLYGRWLAKKWGIDPKAKTPAVLHNDGQDYVPTDGWTVFAHQFSSIAGAGPVTGAIQAAAFGWLPVFLWIILGGIFFGAVTDFGALYASVKNDGKSMGLLIEKYIGKAGRKLFLGFCWLFCLIVIAAFAEQSFVPTQKGSAQNTSVSSSTYFGKSLNTSQSSKSSYSLGIPPTRKLIALFPAVAVT